MTLELVVRVVHRRICFDKQLHRIKVPAKGSGVERRQPAVVPRHDIGAAFDQSSTTAVWPASAADRSGVSCVESRSSRLAPESRSC